MRKILFISIFLLSGCFDKYVTVATPWPVIPEVSKPEVQLPDSISAETTEEYDKIVRQIIRALYTYDEHIEKQSQLIGTYNKAAEKHNETYNIFK